MIELIGEVYQLKIHNHRLVFEISNLNLQVLNLNSQVAKMAIFGCFIQV